MIVPRFFLDAMVIIVSSWQNRRNLATHSPDRCHSSSSLR